MGGGGGAKGGKGGSAGQATNADLQSDEDIMARRLNFSNWKRKKRPNQMIDYVKSPNPPVKRH